MTGVTNNFSGVGVAVRSQVSGIKNGKPAQVCSIALHDNAAAATGIGTGSIAQLILEGKLTKPGVWSVEQALSTELFERSMESRHLKIDRV